MIRHLLFVSLMLTLPFLAYSQEVNPCVNGNSPNISSFGSDLNSFVITTDDDDLLTGCYSLNGQQITNGSLRVSDIQVSNGEGSLGTIFLFNGPIPTPVATIELTPGTDETFNFNEIAPSGQLGIVTELDNPGTLNLLASIATGNSGRAVLLQLIIESGVLPVNWVDELAYRPFGEQLRLDYSVSDQVDVAGYELEAFAGQSFEKVKGIDYVENGALETRYSVLTQWPTEATYYRIKQLDHDGSHDYSNVIFVPGNEKSAAEMMLFPNPATNTVRMTVPEGVKQVDLIDASGRLMQSYDAELARGGIDVSGVAEGMYFIRPVGADAAGTPQRLVIRH